MQTFEDFLRDVVWDAEGVLDDDMPDAFDTWISEQDVEELLNWGSAYGKYCFNEGQNVGLVQGGKLATDLLVNKLK